MTSIEDIRNERIAKAQSLIANGVNLFPADSHITHTSKNFLDSFDTLFSETQEMPVITIGGRTLSLRQQGKVGFVDLFDGSIFNQEKPVLQVFLSVDAMGEEVYKSFFDTIDTGDFVEFTGTAYITKRGHKSLLAKNWRIISKSLRPIPDGWFGLKDEDERYRKRYLDLILTPDLRNMVLRRSIFWNTIRSFLLRREYIEVETPILENTTGGADARPFETHHNALDIDVYLRISAGELWQKRLLVAGLPKTFEIGRIFRNEGMSNEHLQDYTQMECYEAYSDFTKGMEMIREMYRGIAMAVYGKTTFIQKEHTFDLAGDWVIYNFCDMLKEAYNIDPVDENLTVENIAQALKQANIDFDPNSISIERGVDLLWKKIRKTLAGPGFLIGIPVYLETLAKKSRTDNRVVERFQVILAGSEVGKGFSELNDPIDQEERFRRQQALRDAGDDEAQMADLEYVEAMEYGMPPAFGFGISERLFSFLEGKSVREAQIFPLMKKIHSDETPDHSA